jgi:hypothetical protein
MVFYHGDPTPYPYALDLRHRFRTPEHADHTLCGPPQLIDVRSAPDAALLQQDRMGLVSYFFKHVRDQDVLPALGGVLNQLQGLISALFRADGVATRRNRTTMTPHCALSAQKMAQNHCHSAN